MSGEWWLREEWGEDVQTSALALQLRHLLLPATTFFHAVPQELNEHTTSRKLKALCYCRYH